MAFVSVANYKATYTQEIRGQSFTPNNPGPDGIGPPTSAMVDVNSITFGYNTYDANMRAGSLYIYDAPVDDPSDIGGLDHLVATAFDFQDSLNALGSSKDTRTFFFDLTRLQAGLIYYIYFGNSQVICVVSGSVYTGGAVQDFQCDDDPAITTQFEVAMSEVV